MMPYAVDQFGRPVFFISSMAMHTQNLRQDPRASRVYGRRVAFLREVKSSDEARSVLVEMVRQARLPA
jgi:putative heme iron utilization protein